MNCVGFRKFVGAFADGELDVSSNLDALEHLNMCPRCSGRVTEIQALKATLRRQQAVTAPASLRERVTQSLRELAEIEPAVDVGPASATEVESNRVIGGFFSRWALPLGMAAAVLVACVVWWMQPQPTPAPGTMTVQARQAVADICAQHSACVAGHGFDHFDPKVGRDAQLASMQLSDSLSLPVLVPDLCDYGMEFVGADRCGVRGRKGAHALYHCTEKNTMISVFSLPRVPELEGAGRPHCDGRVYAVFTKDGQYVVTWHDRESCYAVCSSEKLPEEVLLKVADCARSRPETGQSGRDHSLVKSP